MPNVVAKNLTEVRRPSIPGNDQHSQDYYNIDPNDFLIPGESNKKVEKIPAKNVTDVNGLLKSLAKKAGTVVPPPAKSRTWRCKNYQQFIIKYSSI